MLTQGTWIVFNWGYYSGKNVIGLGNIIKPITQEQLTEIYKQAYRNEAFDTLDEDVFISLLKDYVIFFPAVSVEHNSYSDHSLCEFTQLIGGN